MNSPTTWPLRHVARAAGMKDTVLRQLFVTDVLRLHGEDIKRGGTGNKVGLTKNRAYEAAIVQQLKIHGVSVSRAARAAFEFTINGNNGRAAGELFPLGRTVLIITPTGAVVSNVDFDSRVSDLSNNGVAIVLDLNKIVSDVNALLDNS